MRDAMTGQPDRIRVLPGFASPVAPDRARGYNLVEVLVVLTIASIITLTLVSFVNDVDMRHKVAIARADVNRIATAAHLAEADAAALAAAPGNSQGILNLTSSSKLSWSLESRLLELPTEDPWGNRFITVTDAGKPIRYERVTDTTNPLSLTVAPTPYIIDEGLGRVISAGPDGIVDTRIGQDPADSEADIVVEYRHKPWLFYNLNGRMYVNSADGGANTTNPAGIEMGPGVNAQVSPDGLRFAAFKAGKGLVLGDLTWTLSPEGATPIYRETDEVVVVPRARVMTFVQNRWQSDTTPVTVDANTFPLWLPDSSGIVFQSSGDIYRYDAARGEREGSNRGEVLKLTDHVKLNAGSGATSTARVLYSTRRSAAYVDPDATFFMAVASDGKVAFRDTGGGLSLVLGDGTARRTIKPGGDYAPLAWIDNNNILYWDRAAKRLFRVAQDGTIDIPLHEAAKPDIDAVLNPVLSSEGKYLAFLQKSTGGNVIKTDGTGFVVPDVATARYDFTGPAMLGTPPMYWREGLDCGSHRTLYLPSSDSGRPVLSLRFDSSDRYVGGNSAASITNPDGCTAASPVAPQSTQAGLLAGLHSLYYHFSRDQKLLAVVSDSDSTARPAVGRGGIFVVPITGDAQAMTQIQLREPIQSGSYTYVQWLMN